MSKRPKEQAEALSLFPFLSILTCLIGTLTMLIAALALRQVSGDRTAERHGAELEERLSAYKQLQAHVRNDQLEAERLRKLLAEAEARRQRLAADAETLKLARATLERDARKRAEAARLLQEADKLKKQVDQLTADIARLTQELAEKKKELAAREQRKAPTVTVRPSGSAKGLKPFFVECTADSLVLYDGPAPKRISKRVLKSDASYAALLARVKAQADATVIFLIRSAGIHTYREASALAEASATRYGKLPVVGDGGLDLSRFGVNDKDPKP